MALDAHLAARNALEHASGDRGEALAAVGRRASACEECLEWRRREHPIQGRFCDQHWREIRAVHVQADEGQRRARADAQRIYVERLESVVKHVRTLRDIRAGRRTAHRAQWIVEGEAWGETVLALGALDDSNPEDG